MNISSKASLIKLIFSSGRGTNLLKSGLFSDISIHVGSSVFKCHKIILACFSEFFEKLFQKEGLQSGIVTLEGTTPEIFEIFLDFIYAHDNEQLENTDPEVLMSLLKCANMWLVEEVEDRCTEILLELCDDMESGLLIKLYGVSYQIDHKLLMDTIMQILFRFRRDEVDYPTTDRMEIDCFVNYFQNTENMISTQRRFIMIENWIKRNIFEGESSSKMDRINEIVKSIDFEEMSLEEFYNGPGKSSVLSDSDKFEIMYKMARSNNQWTFIEDERKRDMSTLLNFLTINRVQD
ncbi:hypothetical protein KR084_002531 [Drosophila pseudotakahashii]|nr:hypothetical protein KR084_002531 [Drosophila pseudotakahashii]